VCVSVCVCVYIVAWEGRLWVCIHILACCFLFDGLTPWAVSSVGIEGGGC
jgi:hypothetical protein